MNEREFLSRPRPSGKAEHGDRPAIRRLWSLLYRAVRRTSTDLAALERRVARLEERERRERCGDDPAAS